MTVISIAPDDLDKAEACAATKALSNLAAVHQLPRLEHIYLVERTDGHTVVNIALPEIAADPWRRALGAPEFATTDHVEYRSHKTEVFWFGSTVRLHYTTL